mmetsp:Transcript_1486/g.5106  ORF Transcript_1486/g.5106 Transcript_1486/m.5106 type:complete len:241 (-) Transcript_1486:296-1018(-)
MSATPPSNGLGDGRSGEGSVRSAAGKSEVRRSRERDDAVITSAGREAQEPEIIVKVGLLGDAGTGKSSLIVKYVEARRIDEDYTQTLGVNFLEKSVNVHGTCVAFSIWDLGGQREFVQSLPLVCNDAAALLLVFDLSRRVTLSSVKQWLREARQLNKSALPVLVGTKYDYFCNFSQEEQRDTTKQARKYAKAMNAPLVFVSSRHSVNVYKLFKIIFARVFGLPCTIPQNSDYRQGPIIEY